MLAGGLVADLVDLEVCGPGIPGPERILFLALLVIVGCGSETEERAEKHSPSLSLS